MALPLSYNIRNIAVRWRVTLLAVGGISLVVAVLLVLTAMANGFRAALRSTGSKDNAIVVQRGSNAELTSGFTRDNASMIMVDSRVARDESGKPLASPEIVLVASLPRKSDGSELNVTVRGVSQQAFKVRQGVRVIEGRNFTPGLYELVVGKQVAERYAGAQVGSSIRLQRRSWTVVGVFSSEGSGFESEVWGDVDVMGAAFNRSNGYQSLTLRLKDASQVSAFDNDLQRNPSMQVQMQSEYDFYEKQAGQTAQTLIVLAVFVGVVMGIGAIFGAMNTMYGLVASRTREIGTLRALGFSRGSILLSFLTESVLLAAGGFVAGIALGVIAMWTVNTLLQGVAFSMMTFSVATVLLQPSLAGVGLGLVFALAIGIFGGLAPAWRASRLRVVDALHRA